MSDALKLTLALAGILLALASPFIIGWLVSRDSRTDDQYAHLRGERS